MKPREGASVHYVQHRGRGCVTGLVANVVHPASGDDGHWCVSLDEFGAGSSHYLHHHVPHGQEPGHWHHTNECED